ncbi:MAG: glycosyltransferase family 4 protein [Ruminococcaceae bacterium]|nr:glycosyltransferase family 4 protein [Oscillospiraceae bacterium]
MSIKICLVTTSSKSIDSFMFPCVPTLKKYGFDVTFVTSCEKGFIEKCEEAGVKVHHYPVGRGFDLKGTLKAARRFKKLCLQEKFDMVVYSTPNGALYGSIGSKAAKVPCRVLAQWGMRYVGFEGWKRTLIRNIEKISCRKATDIRNVSEKNRALAIQDGMYKPEKCKVLGQGGTVGVDLSLYQKEQIPAMRKETREKFQIPNDALVYGFVGRICRDKGVGELLSAFSLVQKENPNAYLLLIGGLDDNHGLTQGLIEEAQKNPNIVFCGQVPVEQVSKRLAAADVLVHPTYREGFGMVLQEAAAMYLPTITTNIIGASEAIVNGETGLLAEKQDVETLKEAMISMFDADLRKTFGENGRKRIENEFERGLMVERICRDYLELYELRCKNKEK